MSGRAKATPNPAFNRTRGRAASCSRGPGVDGEHCVAILDIDTVFGPIPFAEHIQVVDEDIVSVRGYYDLRPMLGEENARS